MQALKQMHTFCTYILKSVCVRWVRLKHATFHFISARLSALMGSSVISLQLKDSLSNLLTSAHKWNMCDGIRAARMLEHPSPATVWTDKPFHTQRPSPTLPTQHADQVGSTVQESEVGRNKVQILLYFRRFFYCTLLEYFFFCRLLLPKFVIKISFFFYSGKTSVLILCLKELKRFF